MKLRLFAFLLGITGLLVGLPTIVRGETNIRTRMLIIANIDGYPSDDDVIAIGRFLRVAGDLHIALPDDIGDWISSRIGELGPLSTARLTAPFMHFLRNGAVAPPFVDGPTGSARDRLLTSIATQLRKQPTPLANLALLMFTEVDNPALRHLAASADYGPLKSFPWLIGFDDWMPWIWFGLQPDGPTPQTGLLTALQGYLSGLDFRPPVSASTGILLAITTQNSNWGSVKGAKAAPYPTAADLFIHFASWGDTISGRIGAILGLPSLDKKQVQPLATWTAYFPDLSQFSANIATTLLYTLPFAKTKVSRTGNEVTRLGSILGEQQARLSALAAYALVAYQQNHRGAAEDVGIDDVFSKLAAITLPSAEAKTTVVPSLVKPASAAAAGADLATLSKCHPTSFEVIGRRVSVRERTYLETIQAKCKDGTSFQLAKDGAIPTDIDRLLEINSGFLDIVHQSLATRDLSSELVSEIGDPDDLYLVANNPWLSLAISLANLAHPEAPWRQSRDVLLAHYPRSLEWFTPGWRPAPVGHQTAFEGRVLRTKEEFPAARTNAFIGETLNLQWEAERHFLSGVAPTLDKMPSEEYVCLNYSDSQGSGMSCGNRRTAKGAWEVQFNAIVADAMKAGRLRGGMSDPRCLAPQTHTDDQLNTVIEEDTLDFVVQYTTDDCTAAEEGQIPPEIDALLNQVLQADPFFLNRYQFDLLPSSPDIQQHTAEALGAASMEPVVVSRILSFLISIGLSVYLPDIPAPSSTLNGLNPLRKQLVLDRESPLEATLAPLLSTQGGLDLATDLDTLQRLASTLPSEGQPQLSHISDDWLGQLRTQESKSIAQIYQSVDNQVATVVAAISAQTQSNFVVGFGIGIGPGVLPGVYFSYQGVGIDVSLGLPSTLFVKPILPPVSIPDIPVVFSGTGPLGPLVPTVAIPLGAVPRTSTGAPDLPELPPGVQDPSSRDVSVSIPAIDWGSLLAHNNYVGRLWLQDEIEIATPLLSPAQIQQITQALGQPSFPTDLAKLIAQTAEKTSGNTSVGEPSLLLSQSFQAACGGTSWQSCGIEVARSLDSATDATQVVNLALLWDHSFNVEYDALRKRGRLENAVPEADRIFEVVNDGLNPVEIAKDSAKESLLKRYLPMLATVVEWANKPIVVALKTFFDSQDVASDYDEMQLMDHTIQDKVAAALEPYLKDDWKDRLTKVVEQAGPKLKAP